VRHFIGIADTSADELRHVMDVARRLKAQLKSTGRNDPVLAGKSLAMVFEKPSLRTRVSFAVGMHQLGGMGLVLSRDEVGLGTREPVQDVARVLSGMCDGIMARVFEHEKLLGLAAHASVPVINGLSDYSHPCQALADLMTVEEHFGRLAGLTLAYVGDGNNVARSLAVACARFGVGFRIATPPGFELPADDLARIKAKVPELSVEATHDPIAAAAGADVLVTDTWVSMGQEQEKAERQRQFAGFTLDAALLRRASPGAIVLHCLPAYRGYEVSEEVFEGPQSKVFAEAENRLHAQKGLLAVLMGGM